MKQLLRFKTFLILALLAMVGNSAWAQDESVTFSSQGYTNAQEISSYSGTSFSVTFAKGTNSNNAPKYYNTGKAIRCYGGNTITVSSSTKTIASVQFSFGSSDGSNAITASVGDYSQGEWTGSANSVTFTIGGSSGNRRIAGISVTYEAGGDPTVPQKVNPELAWSASSASAIVGEDFTAPTLTNPNNVAVTYESTNESVATISANGEVSVVAAGETTIKAVFAGDDTYNAQTVSYTLTVTAPAVVYTSLKDLQDNVTSTPQDFTLQMTDIYVTAVKNKNAYISDGTYGALIYTDGHGLEAGQKLNGTLSAKYVLYHGQTEITNFSTSGLTITSEALPAQTKAIGDLSGANQSLLVTLENVTYDGTVLTDGTNSITPYTTFMSDLGLESGKTYNVTGIVILYNTTLEIAPRKAEDIVEVGAPATPSITLPAGYQFEVNADGGDNELPVTCSNMPANPQLEVRFYESDGTTSATYDWISATINDNGNIYGQIQENTGDARTAYFKVHGVDADNNDVYSNLVTFTQEAPVAATPTIVFNPESIDFDANGGYRTIGGDYFQLKDFDSTPSLEILYYESDGDTEKQGGYDWLTADFNSNNQIDFAWNTNTGAARSAYLKIHAVGTTVYSNLFTVNQAAPTTDYVTLPFNWAGGASADLTAIAGVTASGIGSDYAATHDPYLVKFDSDGDYIQFKTNEQPGVVTIGVKMIGGGNTSTITVQGSADGDKFTDIEELTISGKQNDIVNLETTTSFAATDRYVRLTFTKGSNVGVGPITIAKYVATPSITITPATVNAKANDNGGELTVTYENLAATPSLQIVFVESDGETAATYNWISAEFNSNGNIDGILQPNTGDARTAYLVVTGVDADNNVVKSNLVTINQAAPAAPSITVEKGSIDFVAGGESDRKMSFEYESLGNSPSFEVVFFDELGTTVTTYDWVTTATIENNEKVNLSVAQNDGAARTAYFKVHETATDVYSNLVTINQAAAADPNTIIFDFTTNDWGLPLTSENVSERREFKKDGYTIALTAGGNNKYGFNTDGYLLLGKNGATLEFPIFDFLVDKITIEGNTGASTSVKQAIYMKTYSEGLKQASSTTTGATGTNEYNISWGCQAAGEELLLQVTSAHNTQITRILIHKKETVDVTIGSTGYATLYYGDKNFSYGRKGGVSAYAVNLTNGALKMEAISNQAVIPAGTAMVLEGNPGTHVFEVEDAAFSSIAAEAEVNFTGCDNLLRGYDEPALTTGPDAGDYLFYLLGVDNGKVGFYWGKAEGAAFTSGAHKAYLAVPTEQASGLRGFSFDGSVVGINTIGVDMPEGNAYDLQGRRVQQLQKNGLYIVDGKKMLAK